MLFLYRLAVFPTDLSVAGQLGVVPLQHFQAVAMQIDMGQQTPHRDLVDGNPEIVFCRFLHRSDIRHQSVVIHRFRQQDRFRYVLTVRSLQHGFVYDELSVRLPLPKLLRQHE